MNTNVAKCLLVSKVLVADGMMSDDERAFLTDMMARLGLSDAEKKQVVELEGWDEAEPIVTGLSEDERREIVDMLVDAEKKQVIELEGWDEAEPIVNQLSEEERREIVEMLVDAASADGRLSPHELTAVKRVSAALKI